MKQRVLLWTGTLLVCGLAVAVISRLSRQAFYRIDFSNRWMAAMDDPDPQVRLEAVRVVAELILDQDERIRMNAAWRLADVRGPEAREAVPRLVLALRSRDSGVRFAALTALANIGPEAAGAVPALCEELMAPDGLRNDAARLLAELGAIAVPALKDVLKGNDPNALCYAIRALGDIGREAEGAAPELTTYLQDRREFAWHDTDSARGQLRYEAAEALSKILGRRASAAVPVLTEALHDEKNGNYGFPAEALRRIDPEAAKRAGVK